MFSCECRSEIKKKNTLQCGGGLCVCVRVRERVCVGGCAFKMLNSENSISTLLS